MTASVQQRRMRSRSRPPKWLMKMGIWFRLALLLTLTGSTVWSFWHFAIAY
ncbi:MAG: hypothetical protein MUD14_08475 [Hydrococcus sp. Prado102]|jgi:hypothetical protein|nr:hypothetical protein [Hydrococcus sp. Prado102]